jgi:hypothetical protein
LAAREENRQTKIREHLARGYELLRQWDYEGSLQENRSILSIMPEDPLAEEALFNLGLIYADPSNPNKDMGKSFAFFQRLTTETPGSQWTDRARVWLAILKQNERLSRQSAEAAEEVAKLKRQSAEADKETTRLNRQSADAEKEVLRLRRLSAEAAQEVAKLKQIVEQSRAVDMEIEEKKRSQGK